MYGYYQMCHSHSLAVNILLRNPKVPGSRPGKVQSFGSGSWSDFSRSPNGLQSSHGIANSALGLSQFLARHNKILNMLSPHTILLCSVYMSVCLTRLSSHLRCHYFNQPTYYHKSTIESRYYGDLSLSARKFRKQLISSETSPGFLMEKK